MAKKDFFRPEDSTPAELNKFTDFYKSSGVRDDLTDFLPSLTRQEFAEECDINTIMARYESTGTISHVNRSQPIYLDTTLYPSLQASMEAFREANTQFNALPAHVRREFDNDPQKFVDFAVDPANLPRMREWGLAPPEAEAPGPVRVEVVNTQPVGGTPPDGGSKAG